MFWGSETQPYAADVISDDLDDLLELPSTVLLVRISKEVDSKFCML